jgi:acetyl esterase/lipase
MGEVFRRDTPGALGVGVGSWISPMGSGRCLPPCSRSRGAGPIVVDAPGGTRAAPLRAPLEQLSGLPDALVIVDENDVLRDEGEAYARRLSEAGVRVTSVRYNGTIHDFMLLNAITGTPAVRSAVALATGALKAALHK